MVMDNDTCFILIYDEKSGASIREMRFAQFVEYYSQTSKRKYEDCYIELASLGFERKSCAEDLPASSVVLRGERMTVTLINSKIEDEVFEHLTLSLMEEDQ
jgi:hypothetical protein